MAAPHGVLAVPYSAADAQACMLGWQCVRPGCGKPSWNGQKGEFCSKRCRDASPKPQRGALAHVSMPFAHGPVAATPPGMGAKAVAARLAEWRCSKMVRSRSKAVADAGWGTV
eukprot:CAMPEP_0171104084 /NCGR_PEP_ID=MMETSP0766_2-20121228/59970_1 /TAXON_ID=439317 /ORGANISM="Gambierdiscus australes, Strain CAWD 149" /LENGTH=112 /DNA_ID=CAMNT_0011564639 /DNA_START=54 /DNA_END=393 /DNA_ORIENTATION=+